MSGRQKSLIRLGINIDHVATLRQARRTSYPDIMQAAKLALSGGADSITVHLREDRRHIQDGDVTLLVAENGLRLNLEMAITEEMVNIACGLSPENCCLVPEKREELTTEGGLDVAGQLEKVSSAVERLTQAGVRVALFIDAEAEQLEAAVAAGCEVIELHTGTYADAKEGADRDRELARLTAAANKAEELGITVHAGHGLTVQNVSAIAALPQVEELNIGHAIVARAVFIGIANAVAEMKQAIRKAETT